MEATVQIKVMAPEAADHHHHHSPFWRWRRKALRIMPGYG